MKVSKPAKISTKPTPNVEKTIEKEVSDEKDLRDLDDSLTDWNAEQNQSGRHK